MEEDDEGCPMIRLGVSGWMFLLVQAYPGSPGQNAVKRLCVRVCVCKQIHKLLPTKKEWRLQTFRHVKSKVKLLSPTMDPCCRTSPRTFSRAKFTRCVAEWFAMQADRRCCHSKNINRMYPFSQTYSFYLRCQGQFYFTTNNRSLVNLLICNCIIIAAVGQDPPIANWLTASWIIPDNVTYSKWASSKQASWWWSAKNAL